MQKMKMFSSMLIYVWACLAVSVYASHHGSNLGETCTTTDFTYSNIASSSSFTSVKSDGSQYLCQCTGENCRDLLCTRMETMTDTRPSSHEGDTIRGSVVAVNPPTTEQTGETDGSVPGGVHSAGESHVNPVYIMPQPLGYPQTPLTCYDRKWTHKNYQHDETFQQIRGNIPWSCTCTITGRKASIACNRDMTGQFPHGYQPINQACLFNNRRYAVGQQVVLYNNGQNVFCRCVQSGYRVSMRCVPN